MGKINSYKTFFLIVASFLLGLVAFMILPSSTNKPLQVQAQVWTGGQCNFDGQSSQNCCNNVTHVRNRTGWTDVAGPGHCINVNTQSCPGGRVVPSNIWLCPGGNSIRCCVPIVPPAPPTATPTPPLPRPTNVRASCTLSGNVAIVTVTWNQVSGYPYYYARIHNETTNTEGSYSGVITGSSYSFNTAVPGQRYSYWVHVTNAAGNPWSTEVPPYRSTTVTCPTRFDQSTTTPGIIFSGNGTANFGLRGQTAASVRSWLAGGLTYPELYPTSTNVSSTSYQYILDRTTSSQVQIINLPIPNSTCSSLTNCTLPAGLARGVYRANSALTLNAYNFPANSNYVFLVNGDLTLQGSLVIPNGSTAFFAASRDIIVATGVGSTSNGPPLPGAQIQGLFTANRDFVIQGINNCITGPDRMLNIEGAIVVNASGTGGALINNRDLCGSNPSSPSYTVRSRVDFLLNMPEFLMKRATVFREDAP
jgi:hypothetical protein